MNRSKTKPPLKLSLALKANPKFAHFLSQETPPKFVEKAFSGEISAGKNTYVYDAHTYHTKVPPQGIEQLIEYYTSSNAAVLDPFCGSGMTGVAAMRRQRKALLSDLSPAATFIARNLNTPIEAQAYLSAVRSLLEKAAPLEAALYNTKCRECGHEVPMLYTVWSFGVLCPHCEKEFVLWDVARDEHDNVRESKILSEFDCPHCATHLKKRGLKRTKRYPVEVGYRCCRSGLKETKATPNKTDLQLLARIEAEGVPKHLWYPTTAFPKGVNTRQPIAAGITSVDKAYTPRALNAMAFLWNEAAKWPDKEMRDKLLFTLTSLYQRVTVFSEFRFWGGSGNTANYNVPSIMNEQNIFRTFMRKANTISWYFKSAAGIRHNVEVSTQSASCLHQIPDKSIDYIFTDPPFGGNINYSEMNFLWESWLSVWTETKEEAIVNAVQGKGIKEYGELLSKAFKECRRVLKEEAWMTVIFHNSSDAVWMSLQRALVTAGFLIGGTQTFDKKHGTFKQFVSDNAVGYDLVLHCQKSTANLLPRHQPKEALVAEAVQFVTDKLKGNAQNYCVEYLHVNRTQEVDYRKFYAEWLASCVGKTFVSLSFEEFRAAVSHLPVVFPQKPFQLELV